jgi:hypothetical protein
MAAGLGEVYAVYIFGPDGGGLRTKAMNMDTSLDGKRETLRSFWTDYNGVALGSTIRKISIKEQQDFDWINQGIDFEAAFVQGTILSYKIVKLSNQASAEGSCHVGTGPKITSGDGKVAEIDVEFEGDPALFSDSPGFGF